MANYNLTAQQIKDTFPQLAQVSASNDGGAAGSAVLDGVGTRVNVLHATSSHAVSSSFATSALSASYAPNTGVTKIVAGTNVTISPVGGTGDVTINSSGGGGGAAFPFTGSAGISGSLSVNGPVTAIGGKIQLGDTGSGNSIDLPVNSTAIFKGSTDFTQGAYYFADQLNFGGAMKSSGAGSSMDITEGTQVDFKTDVNISASKQLIGTASYATFAATSSNVTDPNIAYINKNNTFTGTQSFNNISVSGTGSFGYIQSVTGSAKTIGDAFIILNNDTPTQVYAGVKVQDSGSTATTASIQWDGTNDQWFFEKEVSGAGEFGVVMGGPEYSAIGSPAYLTNNKIAKGNGSHHLNDSNITDDGTSVTVSTSVTSSNGFSSTGFNQASKFNGDVSAFSLTTTGAVTAKSSFSTTAGMTIGEATAPKRLGYFTVYSNAGKWGGTGNAAGLYIIDQSGSDAFVGQIGNFSNPFDSADTGSFIIQGGANADSPYQNTIMYANETTGFPHFVKSTYFDKPVIISSSLELTGSLNTGDIAAANIVASTAVTSSNGFSSTGFNKASKFNGSVTAFSFNTSGAVTANASFSKTTGFELGEVGTPKREGYYKVHSDANSWSGVGNAAGLYVIDANQSNAFVGTIGNFSNPYDVADTGVFMVQGGANADSSYGNTILYANETNGFPHFVKTTFFDEPLKYEKSTSGKQITLTIAANTASLDPSTGDYFSLTLVSGSNTLVDVGYADSGRGSTFILECKQPSPVGGTVTFANAKFPGGVAPVSSTAGTDIYTFVGINGGDSYGTQTANFI